MRASSFALPLVLVLTSWPDALPVRDAGVSMAAREDGSGAARRSVLPGSSLAARPVGVGASAQTPEDVEADLGLDRRTRRLIQQGLRREGFDPGPPDGLFGQRTRNAIRRWQAARDLSDNGYLDAVQADALMAAGRLSVTSAARRPDSDGRDLRSDDIDRIARAVVRVVALQGGEEVSSGSGTVVDADGLVFTNRHVVEGAGDYRVDVLEDVNELPVPRYHARVVGYAMDVDFAVLQIDRDDQGRPIPADRIDLPHLSAAADGARRGDEIFVFGYPGIGDGYLVFTEGSVTTIRNGTMNGQRLPVWYQTDAQVAPGSSGGLAVNARGEMVGIPTMVRSEARTGGRLGGVLAWNAVRAAVEGGLETDLSRIAAATIAPVIDGGRLTVDEAPTFGSVALSAGFIPDPHTIEMVSGGEITADYLGGACTGYAAESPDVRVHWSGRSTELRVFFAADDGGDTTLVINRPDGSWICNDDSDGSLDPMVALRNPPAGQYDIWVGSFEAGAFVAGTLNVTERDLDPVSSGPSAFDPLANPTFDVVDLRAGFTPDPNLSWLVGGGRVDASYLGGECTGYAGEAPDVRLQWRGASDVLGVFFAADEGEDAVLVVNLPDGTWVCNDDEIGLDPAIVLEHPEEGQYDIWVGSHAREQYIPGVLAVAASP